jgi:Cu/Ag efflux pump CusA
MLSAIVRFSLRFRGVIIALACIFFGYGLYTLARATYDVFPEFAPPQAVIQTQAPGLTPEQVEVLVTQLLENALNGLAGIEGPMALVILGGLMTSTALNLPVLPTLALRYGRFERPDQETSVN